MMQLNLAVEQGWVHLWSAFALTLLVTVLGRSELAARFGRFRGHLFYFGAFATLLLAVPVAVGAVLGGQTQLARWGLTFGNLSVGLLLLVLALPAIAVVVLIASRDRELSGFYPLAGNDIDSPASLVFYELIYLVCYYPAWELCFRGVFFLALIPLVGVIPALGIETALSVLMHIGHPRSEVLGTVVGGVLFGLVALLTGSVFYSFLIHAAIGISVDVVGWRRSRGALRA